MFITVVATKKVLSFIEMHVQYNAHDMNMP